MIISFSKDKVTNFSEVILLVEKVNDKYFNSKFKIKAIKDLSVRMELADLSISLDFLYPRKVRCTPFVLNARIHSIFDYYILSKVGEFVAYHMDGEITMQSLKDEFEKFKPTEECRFTDFISFLKLWFKDSKELTKNLKRVYLKQLRLIPTELAGLERKISAFL